MPPEIVGEIVAVGLGNRVGVPVALETGLDVGGPGVRIGEEVVGREVIGWAFGEAVGLLVRATTGLDVGDEVAPLTGDVVGSDVLAFFVGDVVGSLTGAAIIGAGDGVTKSVGGAVGSIGTFTFGLVVGAMVVGSIVTTTGLSVGRGSVGACEIVGIMESVGCGVLGDMVGVSLGRNVGDLVGEKVTLYE